MEIQGKINNFLDPYGTASSLDKSGEAKLKNRASSASTDASQGDTVSVSQDALLLTKRAARPEHARRTGRKSGSAAHSGF